MPLVQIAEISGMKKALLFGASGLIGSHVLDYLKKEEEISSIQVFNRSSQNYNSETKVHEIIHNLKNPREIEDKIQGDLLFICLGTTIKKAGSQEKFREIDYELPLKIAQSAKNNGVKSCLLISSLGADANSGNFYLQVKGQLEEAILELGFNHTVIMQPSMLLGKREEFRLGEWIGKNMMSALSFLFIGPLAKYKAIHAKDVAKVMVAEMHSQEKEQILPSDIIAARASSAS